MNQMRIDYLASRLCSAGYEETQRRMDFMLDDYIHAFGENHDWEVFVGESHTHNFAVFRGCHSGSDMTWRDVFKAVKRYFTPVRGNPYRLNRDFYEAWAEMSPQVYKAITTIQYTQASERGVCKPWVFCGHSIGGAVATIAAAAFKPELLTTFAAPRVGGKAFVEEVEDACQWRRWDDGSDVVSLLPLRGFQTHGGDLYYIDTKGTLQVNPSTAEVLCDFGKLFKRHDIEHYVEWLEEGL